MVSTRTGLMIIRAWVEEDSVKPLRAHLRLTTNIADGVSSEMTLADVPGVTAAVEVWLRAFLEPSFR